MSEKPPKLTENVDAAEFLALAHELSERRERYNFPGLDPVSRQILLNEQAGIPVEYVLDIDAFSDGLTSEGMRVVVEGTQVYVCRFNDPFVFKNDTVEYFFPRHLNPGTITDPKLKRLVELSKIHPLI